MWRITLAVEQNLLPSKPHFLGESYLAPRSPLKCFAYLYKKPPKRKAHRHSRTCQKHSAGKVFHKGGKRALVTNIPNHVLNGIKITRLYSKRMQIEESFSDLKSPSYGLALRNNRTRNTKRIDILLLMALLAEIIMWWKGLVAMQAKWQYDFQANTIKHRRVLSIPRLGKEVRCHRRYRIKDFQYHWAMLEYQRLTHSCGLILNV